MGDWKAQLAALRRRMAKQKTEGRFMKQHVKPATRGQIYAIGREMEGLIEKVDGISYRRGDDNPRPMCRYKDGHSDATLAAKHGVSEFAVQQIRVELHGDLQRSDAGTYRADRLSKLEGAVSRLTEQMAEAQRRIEKLEDAVTDPAKPSFSPIKALLNGPN